MLPSLPTDAGLERHPTAALVGMKLRWKARSAVRAAREQPWPVLVLAVLVAAALLWLFRNAQAPHGGRRVAGVTAGLLVLVHAARGDACFLAIAGHRRWRLFCAEYLLLTACPASFLVIGRNTAWAAGVVALAPVVAALPAGTAARGLFRPSGRFVPRIPVPAMAYEWRAGLRGTAIPTLVLYLLAVPFSAVPAVVLALVPINTWMHCAFYTVGEDWAMLQAFELPPVRFLGTKLRQGLTVWLAVSAPFLVLATVREPAAWLAALAVAAGCAAILAGCILAKYAVYRPGRASTVFGVLTPFVLTAAVLVPPVAAWLLFRLWAAARQTLATYLDAFD